MPKGHTPARPQLVYLVFGAHTYHQEAQFSIVSALANLHKTPGEALDIQVYSDSLEPYQHLPVTVHPLDASTREAWNQPYGYHFRSKHVVLRQVLANAPVAALIDTDTFFHQSPIELFRRIKPGTLLCNAIGANFGDNKQCRLHQSLATMLAARGLADHSMSLLNSGVIGLVQEDASLLDQSIALMDEYYPHAQGAYTLEEFCLSVAAYRQMHVNQCTDLLHHYWSRKQLFRAKVQAWLAKHQQAPLSREALEDVARVNTQLPKPPTLRRLGYKALSLTLPSEQRQFLRELMYGCYEYPNEFDRASAPAWWDKALENANARHSQPLCHKKLHQWFDRPGMRLGLGSKHGTVRESLLKRSQR
ncbi:MULTISPECIES: hypothetical protein [Pseudomonas]|uniref:Nucleotide-diphospho-sugar transferase domain-containing protein n=1 Tax=Pseudomonas sp. Hg7Tf TaxID=3236988 RepID=A0AB39HUR5_9PSED|nr:MULTISPECIES: hypothetical protein [Pseudomonas]KJK08991.1 hypothetical protein UB47_04650 [Pseudomonas sp. 5]MDD1975723.1 hypothetical protein [Pseudomonas putida]MDH2560243.1 hypothetical protein [Pseudomonas sp. Hg5Tf]QYX46048.1 hypothetical protein K3F43_15205 [Pseudomonas sp. S11A 273]